MSGKGAKWLEVQQNDAPLIVCFPHTGTDIPAAVEAKLASHWLSRKDADYYVHQLYDFASALGATTIRTALSRTVIDVNRDPSGVSLYPGQTTTELCPLLTFDGEPLYVPGCEPDEAEIAQRRKAFFEPYHTALQAEITRLRKLHARVVVYDAHSIRSEAPRLFDGVLPQLNIGTFDGQSCDALLAQAVERLAAQSPFSWVTNGRFKGGWTTRHYGEPERGVHAIQMELACRGYVREPAAPFIAANWPAAYDAEHAAPLRALLSNILEACLAFAAEPGSDP